MPEDAAKVDNNLSQESLIEGYVKSRVDGFRRKRTHPKSSGLPENPYTETADYGAYRSVLPEYQIEWDNMDQYNEQHPTTRKTDFIVPNNPNLGWKVHLNTTPANVIEVSTYLKDNGFNHKYLSGGELENGKVFTVYVGSFGLATDLSGQLSQDIGHLLSKPKEMNEVEFAPGIVGRFVAQGGTGSIETPVRFSQYGTCGFSWTDEQWTDFTSFLAMGKDDPEYNSKRERMRIDAEQESFRNLQQIFGKYFYDDSVAGVPWK